MNQIDTASALMKMNDTYDHELDRVKTYGLRFITKKGFREIYNARKGVKEPKHQSKSTPTNNRGRSNKKFSGTVQVYDEDLRQFREPFFSDIIAFRDYNSTTWIPVRLT